MAKKVSVVTTDDLDGSQGAETVTFGLDGVTYEIDLGQSDRSRLADALAPFMAAGRLANRSRRRRGVPQTGGPRIDRAAVRAWAREAEFGRDRAGKLARAVLG